MTGTRPDRAPDLRARGPHSSRLWNYWLGGKDNYAADRTVGDAVAAVHPGIWQLAAASRTFLERTVGHLAAECGIRQFVDIGAGVPFGRSVHHVAHAIAADSRVVYVDNDPFVRVHANALLAGAGLTSYVHADFRDADAVLEGAARLLDLDRPVAVLFLGSLGYVPGADEMHAVVRNLLADLAPGSHLALWDGTDTSAGAKAANALQQAIGVPYLRRPVAEIAECFTGLDLVDPGVVMITDWPGTDGGSGPVDGYGGVARVPAHLPSAPRVHRPPATPQRDRPPAVGGPARSVQVDVPHGARIWNYLLGGKDNYAVDRTVADAMTANYPAVPGYARRTRDYLVRMVRYLADEAGIRQFVDIGAGLPAAQNTHEVAQAVDPGCRVVYVDNDPLVLTHARALLADSTQDGRTSYLAADYRDPEALLREAGAVLDLTRPIAVLCMGVFGYVDAAEMQRVTAGLVAALPAGSHLALWDGTDTSDAIRAVAAVQGAMGAPYRLSTVVELEACFTGLELAEPGLVPVTQWRPADPEAPARPIEAWGAVGRKP